MATYKEIQGFAVQNFSQDPVPTVAAWSSGGNLGTGRYSRATFGTQDAAAFAGGGPPSATLTSTEEYDGSSWSSGGALSVARRNLAGCGVQTSGLATGGKLSVPPNPPTATSDSVEEYDGSSWSSGGSLPSVIRGHFNLGTQTASVNCGGSADPPTTSVTTTIEYDGSSWTSGGAMGHGRSDGQGCGVLTASLAVGGRDTNPPYPATPAADTVEEYDGSSWTAGGAYPTAMNALGVAGSQTSAIAFGGNTGGNQDAANFYDGTSFTAAPSLGTARGYVSGCGTQSLALAAGGGSGSNATEEFSNYSEPSTFQNEGQVFYNDTEKKFKLISSIQASTWSTGGTLNTLRTSSGSAEAGTVTAAVQFGGKSPPGLINSTEEYDGTSWTASGNMGTARYLHAGFGTQTAAVAAGGYTTGDVATTEHYNGATWTSATSLPSARRYPNGAGILTAGLCIGGISGGSYPGINNTEEYDGSSWSSGGGFPQTVVGLGATGPQTAALAGGGFTGSPTVVAAKYNGSSWTATPNLNDTHYKGNMAGTSSVAVVFGSSEQTESFDGSTFSNETDCISNGLDTGDGNSSGLDAWVTKSSTGATFEYNKGPATSLEDIDVT